MPSEAPRRPRAGAHAPALVCCVDVCRGVVKRHPQAVGQRAVAEVEVVTRGPPRQAHAVTRVLRAPERVNAAPDRPSWVGGRR